MCGIAGFAAWRPSEPRDVLVRMCDAIRHRGPDEAGYAWDGVVGLGMRRLSIIDLEGGSQPISNEDGSVTVVFNGEIYNYRELRRDLVRRGHRLRSQSDTEVLAHLYEEDGVGLVGKLRGMFVFALWDARREQLLIARDRLGKKPLYYRRIGEGLVFGSELKVLEAAGVAGGAPDRSAVARFLALGYVPDPFTIYSSIFKLEPASTLIWSPHRPIEIARYWAPPLEADPNIDEQTAIEEIRRLLTESVRYRLIADVPIGAFLSGGVDSAAVVAEMSRQMDRPVDTYSIGFSERAYNEAPAAAETARALGTNHHEFIATPDVEALFEQVVLAFDEPFADASAIPTHLVAELAAADLKVVLSGDGGDELFGGYTRYLDFAARNVSIPSALRRILRHAALRLPRGAYGRNRLLELSRDAHGRYVGMVANPLAEAEGGVARPIVAQTVNWNQLLEAGFRTAGKRDALAQLLHVDLLTYLPGDILTKVDRMTMLHSLEARVPLLDHHLVEFAARIPSELKFRDGRGKWIFRRAVADLVSPGVLARPKSGFALPIGSWFRSELRHRLDRLASEDQPLSDFVNPQAVDALVREHITRRRDHSPILWKLMVLSTWLGRHSQKMAEPALATRDWSIADVT